MAENSDQATTTFLISNIHCASCVSKIQETLFQLQPQLLSVTPSIRSSSVTIVHDVSLRARNIKYALRDQGFEICDTRDAAVKFPLGLDGQIGYLDRFLDNIGSGGEVQNRSKQSATHINNCESCRLISRGQDVESALPSAGIIPDVQERMDKPIPLVVIDSGNSDDVWRASLAIGGMTCAACVIAISDGLKEKHWIRNVTINLISNSATVDFVGKIHKNDVVDSIEELGYDAVIDSVLKLDSINKSVANIERKVDILVEGMHCHQCPARVMTALGEYGPRVKIDKPLDIIDRIVKITYTPVAPDFTIRNIVSAIEAVDESLQPKLYHPPSLEERSKRIHAREQLRILLRVGLTFVLAIPTLIIGIIFMSLLPPSNPGRQALMRPIGKGVISIAQWILFILATPVYFCCADVFHYRAMKEIRSMWRPGSTIPIFRRFYRFGSMNMLMSLGTSIAYFSSVAQLIVAGVHPSRHPDDSLFYFDSVVFLTLFLLIGRLIESYSKSRTGDAVAILGKLRPSKAFLETTLSRVSTGSSEVTVVDDEFTTADSLGIDEGIDVDLLEFGDVVRIPKGGSPPCDGIVVKGESRFDESSLTGESRLVKKVIDDEVFSGTINEESPISIRITSAAGSSMLDQIVSAVREGQTRRAPIEHIADAVTGYFVPVVTLIAVGTWIIWLSLGISGVLPKDYKGTSSGGWVAWAIQFPIAVFVVACPCGLALAAPTAIFVGGGLAAQNGILVKGGGEAFQKAKDVKCVIFDKTGTLTMGGEPSVTNCQMVPPHLELRGVHKLSRTTIYGMIRSLEENSSHTVAKALVSYCKQKTLEHYEIKEIEEISGKGMKGTLLNIPTTDGHIEDRAVLLIGNEKLMQDYNIPIPLEAQTYLERWKKEGQSVALAAIRFQDAIDPDSLELAFLWQLTAIFPVSDPIRPEAAKVVAALREQGTIVAMLSGDNRKTAQAIALKVGIKVKNVFADVLPSQKAEMIQNFQRELLAQSMFTIRKKRPLVAMVGDGINDSPALTAADVGIAIGSGSEIAISSADFVLVTSNLESLITLLDLSKAVYRRIMWNFGWAAVYNLAMIPFAAGVLYPLVSGGVHVRLPAVWGSLAMACSSISVVLSSLLLRSRIPVIGFRARDLDE